MDPGGFDLMDEERDRLDQLNEASREDAEQISRSWAGIWT
jgi:hypothetical protein